MYRLSVHEQIVGNVQIVGTCTDCWYMYRLLVHVQSKCTARLLVHVQIVGAHIQIVDTCTDCWYMYRLLVHKQIVGTCTDCQ